MNLKLKAAAITVGVIGSGVIVGFILSYFPMWVVGLIALAFACYIIYSLTLTGLKYDKAVEEISKKYE